MAISTFNGLNIAMRAVLAQQRALDVTSHNIANANTEGYSRQTAELAAEAPLANVSVWGMVFPGQLGQGVTVQSYQRIRDVFTDAQLRAHLADQGRGEIAQRELSSVELAFPEPGADGLQAIMNKYWSTWQDVANNPENLGARQALVQQGEAMASAFRTTAKALADRTTNLDGEIDTTLAEVNAIGAQIMTVDGQIGVLQGSGQQPNDLLDERDRLLDRLAKLGNLTVTTSPSGRIGVQLGGRDLIAYTAGTTPAQDTYTLQPLTRTGTNGIDGQLDTGLRTGKLYGLEHVWQHELSPTAADSYRTQLDQLAYALQTQVNAAHAAGVDLSGAGAPAPDPSADFFVAPAQVQGAASAFAMNPALVASPRLVRAGTPGQGPGSNGNALAVIATRSAVATQGSTFDGFYTGIVTGLGVAAQAAKHGLDATNVVVNSLQERRQSVSGVSLDEEMTNMIKYQHAYAAASRVLSALDDNLNKLINSTGRVGL